MIFCIAMASSILPAGLFPWAEPAAQHKNENTGDRLVLSL